MEIKIIKGQARTVSVLILTGGSFAVIVPKGFAETAKLQGNGKRYMLVEASGGSLQFKPLAEEIDGTP